MNQTKSTKAREVIRNWHLVDATGQVLGRLATDIAVKLMGKAKSNFVRNLDCGDYVVVVNGNAYVTTGKKEVAKTYGTYSGFPGGLREKALWELRKEKPEEPLRRAVYGMLPKNKLRDVLITRLYIVQGVDHPYGVHFSSTQK
jgi:large subunit ribosomal protein L13